MAEWLLVLFFFVVGLELRRELVAGHLRDWRHALVPTVAAVGGMAVPALVYLVVNLLWDGGEPRGWAIPTATDIALAVGVLSLAGRRLPSGLRVFLLTLAVVDDLLALLVIAFFYGGGVQPTVIAAAVGLLVPYRSLGRRLEHWLSPVSTYAVVPLYAVLTLWHAFSDLDGAGVGDPFASPVAVGVGLGLVVGKCLGIVLTTLAVAAFARRVPGGADGVLGFGLGDLVGVGLLGGIGFTVSLYVAGLAFGDASAHTDAVVGVLLGSALSAAAGGVVLGIRSARS